MVEKKFYDGFGFCPEESVHHFRVVIPPGSQQDIVISEHFSWDEDNGAMPASLSYNHDGQLKVLLPRSKWNEIAEDVRAEFNKRLLTFGAKAGKWKTGVIPMSRLLGKELVLLAWAIEDADPATIPTAIRNWLGLAQEERWWLYSMTNAATGHAASGRNKGWRKAVRYALTENPVLESQRKFDDSMFRLAGGDEPVEADSKGKTKSRKIKATARLA